MKNGKEYFSLSSGALLLEARKVPWDSELLGYPVGEIFTLELRRQSDPHCEFESFKSWVKTEGYGLISCRLSHQKLFESELLERNDFRFIEVMLHPEFVGLQNLHIESDDILISKATNSDISLIGEIAASAFGYERFHIDPYLNPENGNLRYKRWVENSAGSRVQLLLKATLNGAVVGFFLVEYIDRQVYWHLTAVLPELKGRGLGVRVWKAMMAQHQKDGMHSILTTISVRNVPVLNLYSKLNFRFQPPEMTFHWTDVNKQPRR